MIWGHKNAGDLGGGKKKKLLSAQLFQKKTCFSASKMSKTQRLTKHFMITEPQNQSIDDIITNSKSDRAEEEKYQMNNCITMYSNRTNRLLVAGGRLSTGLCWLGALNQKITLFRFSNAGDRIICISDCHTLICQSRTIANVDVMG